MLTGKVTVNCIYYFLLLTVLFIISFINKVWIIFSKLVLYQINKTAIAANTNDIINTISSTLILPIDY